MTRVLSDEEDDDAYERLGSSSSVAALAGLEYAHASWADEEGRAPEMLSPLPMDDDGRRPGEHEEEEEALTLRTAGVSMSGSATRRRRALR
jgi:hypothetical protein